MSTKNNYADLRRRLSAVLATWPELTHTVSFAAGALFALERAEVGGLRDRASYGEPDRAGHAEVVRRLLADLDAGQEPPAIWLAGFMYNAAIMRLDVCYERFLEAVATALSLPDPPRTAERLSDTERRARPKMAGQPDMILQFAHHVAQEARQAGRAAVQVRARVMASLNGREPQLLVDPEMDLAAQPRSLRRASWIVPLHQPLPSASAAHEQVDADE